MTVADQKKGALAPSVFTCFLFFKASEILLNEHQAPIISQIL